MRTELVSAPAIEPVSLETMRQHLRLDATGSPAAHEDDDLLAAYIEAARVLVEDAIQRKLINQTWRLWLDFFTQEIQLPFPPVQSVSGVTYVDADGATQTLATDQYTLDSRSTPAWLVQSYDGDGWPVTQGVVNAVTVTFVAGYGLTAASVPAPLRQAILLLVAHFYRTREAVSPAQGYELPFTVKALIDPYRVWLPCP